MQQNYDGHFDRAMVRRLIMMQRQNPVHRADAALRQFPHQQPNEPRMRNAILRGDHLVYADEDGTKVGVFISGEPMSVARNYFEVEIIDPGLSCDICVGLMPYPRPPLPMLDVLPGRTADSVAYHSDGKLYKSRERGRVFGPEFSSGDRIGCRVEHHQIQNDQPGFVFEQIINRLIGVQVFFSKNGQGVGHTQMLVPMECLYPAVGMNSEGEEVRVDLNARWEDSDVTLMAVDCGEEEWSRLHDIRTNGQVLEYVGRGRSISDVGLAQTRCPLTTRYHYFEIQIIDPGENCYIAIGLARRDYPKHRHPGWNRGSIAYHADDGKIFVGSGVGEQFGPECNKGDTMGCGILFPRDYRPDQDLCDEAAWPAREEEVEGGRNELFDGQGVGSSDSEDEEWWEKPNSDNGTKVQVFFTRNGKTVGRREVRIPRGGFYPTVGMLSCREKVKFDLRPLTG